MFIRRVQHTNRKNRKAYATYKLVDSIRTERGPRQRAVLNLGADFDLPKDKWKDLANCIEGILTGQSSLIAYPQEIRTLGSRYARKIIRHQGSAVVSEGEAIAPDYATVDLNSVEDERARTVGAEYVVYETIKELGLDRKLKELGLRGDQVAASCGLIAARMIAPGSERSTHHWLTDLSALDEIMDVDFSQLSLDRVYKVSDWLMRHKDALEGHLRQAEGQLFALQETIILYDLTNTFFEGSGAYNPKARYGKSKEKRSDCPLVTLGLVLDMNGFPKNSRIFAGNISEPKTLETMIRSLAGRESSEDSLIKPTIVLDAGVATEENIQWLKDTHYPYIVVSRKKKKQIPPDLTMVPVKEDDTRNTAFVHAGLATNQETGELELYCYSSDKEKKEEGIKTTFQQRFESELTKARNALSLRGGTKRYEKVLERIGRLKERYHVVSHLYTVTVDKDTETDRAKEITWSRKKGEKTSGTYCLRTDREDLTEQQIWDIYTMLTDIEDAFRSMKSELGLRPIYHQKQSRCDGHIFITVLAYHLLHSIRFKLRHRGIRWSWSTIRRQLSTQLRVTTAMKREDGKVIRIRKSSKAEPSHQAIYDALNLPYQPGRIVKTIL
jgi:transposase